MPTATATESASAPIRLLIALLHSSTAREPRLASQAPAARADSGELEGNVLGAFPEEGLAELGEVLVALDDGREMIARELPRLGGEVDVAVGEQDLGLGNATRIEHDLARVRIARPVLGAEAEIEVAERDPAGLAAPAHVDDARAQRQQRAEYGHRLRRCLLLEAGTERKATCGDVQHGTSLAAAPAVGGDLDELAERRLEFGGCAAADAVAQHREDLGLRTSVDEHHEAKAVARLVRRVQPRELRQ